MLWFSQLNSAEKLLGICLSIILLFLLVVRPANRQKRDRSEMFQFAFAMALVIMGGVGVGWVFGPEFWT